MLRIPRIWGALGGAFFGRLIATVALEALTEHQANSFSEAVLGYGVSLFKAKPERAKASPSSAPASSSPPAPPLTIPLNLGEEEGEDEDPAPPHPPLRYNLRRTRSSLQHLEKARETRLVLVGVRHVLGHPVGWPPLLQADEVSGTGCPRTLPDKGRVWAPPSALLLPILRLLIALRPPLPPPTPPSSSPSPTPSPSSPSSSSIHL